uniref:Fe2OG dioxygenase domain-containing protein n=1 Tax=Oryza nivara TaxID=4536 RepID=A0A0E0IVB9_ORYNI
MAGAGAGEILDLPVVDLASSDLAAAAKSVRKACVEYGFFYVVNHGAEGLVEKVFAESSKFFEQPLGEKMALLRNRNYLGYTPLGADKLDASSKFKGDLNENFCIGPIRKEENFPCWKETMKLYHETALATGKRILSLIALSLNLDAEFFDCPVAFLRLLHYPGEANESDDGNYGASAHSDYGVLTLVATDGTPGLQICREKDKCPQLWEDVHHIEGALIVNIGDLLQRWTNCVFRSTLHRVVAVGKERYSVAFFLHTNPDLVVQCLESCCSEACPPRGEKTPGRGMSVKSGTRTLVGTERATGSCHLRYARSNKQQTLPGGRGSGKPEMVAAAGDRLDLPVVDLASSDLRSSAESIRKACVEYGFFYVVNHGIEEGLLEKVFAESRRFFEQPLEEKMALLRNSSHLGYTPPYTEKLDASSKFRGDLSEKFKIGPIGDEGFQNDANQWPSEERLPCWKETMKLYRATALATGKRILSLVALSLNLDAEFFDCPLAFLRLLHYPGEINESDDGNYGASAHSDYGILTLLATDGIPGLQICKEKDRHPQLWEDVHHIDGSTLHRVVAVGKERYSVAFFLDPDPDFVVSTYKKWRLFGRALELNIQKGKTCYMTPKMGHVCFLLCKPSYRGDADADGGGGSSSKPPLRQKRNPAMAGGGGGGNRLDLPVVDLASSDPRAAAESIRKACVESGFFYVVNHGVEEGLLKRLFAESSKFFELPMEEKMALRRNSNHRGYTPPYAEKLDPSSKFEGDLKESFYIGPIGDEGLQNDANQWPSEERLPSWRETIKMYHASALATGKRILSLIALSLNLDAEFFENIGAFICPSAFLRLLHYPGEVDDSDYGNYGASAHSDYGMITLLATDGTPGLQICKEKDRNPQLWEDVHHIDGSTVHRVVAVGKERYSTTSQ